MSPVSIARQVQDEALRRLPPAQKWMVGIRLYQGARALKRAGLVRLHPEWDDAALDREVARIFRHART